MATKRRSLSMEDKLKLLSMVDRAPKMKKTDLAKFLNLPVSTICTILNNRKAIENCAKKMCGRLSSRKKCKSSPFEDVELVLIAWIKQCYAMNIPINGCHIREKALLVAEKLGVNNFTASNGWLDRFKHRNGVAYAAKKKNSPPFSDLNLTVNEWVNEHLLSLTNGYDSKDIYSADEMGFFYNLLIDKNCQDLEDQHSDDRLTVLLCTNSDGSSKLPPLIIGKSDLPCNFSNFKTLPCKYVKNDRAWVTVTIFEDYLHYVDNELELTGRKILLFVDHCAAHPPNTYLNNIKVVFFPSSCSEEVQPFSMGIINAFKQSYHKTFEHNAELIQHRHGSKNKNVELIEALQFVVLSWDEVDPKIIKDCFIKVGFPVLNANESDCCCKDYFPDDVKANDPSNKLATCGVLTIDELCNQCLSSEVESEDCEIAVPKMDVSFEESNHKTENTVDVDYEIDDKIVSVSDISMNETFQEDGCCLEHSNAQSIIKVIDGDDDEVDKSPPDFEEALRGFKKYKNYVCSFNIDEDMQNTLLLMEIALYKLHNREMLHGQIHGGEERMS